MEEAPEKIYIQPNAHDGWFIIPNSDMFIEYVRKDAFIEKVIGWIDYNNRNGGCNFDGWEKDFKKYMEG
jgi:hypothetical protein